jgi:hypothetical protein
MTTAAATSRDVQRVACLERVAGAVRDAADDPRVVVRALPIPEFDRPQTNSPQLSALSLQPFGATLTTCAAPIAAGRELTRRDPEHQRAPV